MFAVSELLKVNLLSKGVSGLASAVFESAEAPSVLGLRPAVGRLSNIGDAQPSGEAPPVFLSFDYWQKRFGGDTGIIGTTVSINALPFVIAGVTPAGFHGITLGIAPDITLPPTRQMRFAASPPFVTVRVGPSRLFAAVSPV